MHCGPTQIRKSCLPLTGFHLALSLWIWLGWCGRCTVRVIEISSIPSHALDSSPYNSAATTDRALWRKEETELWFVQTQASRNEEGWSNDVISFLDLRPGSHSPEQKTTTLPLVTLPPKGRLCALVTFRVQRHGSIECCGTFNWSVLITASTRLGALQAQKHGNILAKVHIFSLWKRAAKQANACEQMKWVSLRRIQEFRAGDLK